MGRTKPNARQRAHARVSVVGGLAEAAYNGGRATLLLPVRASASHAAR